MYVFFIMIVFMVVFPCVTLLISGIEIIDIAGVFVVLVVFKLLPPPPPPLLLPEDAAAQVPLLHVWLLLHVVLALHVPLVHVL